MNKVDVLFICSRCGQREAASRRIVYFKTYFESRGMKSVCVAPLQLSKHGITEPHEMCYKLPFYILTRNPIIDLILNFILSSFVLLYVLIFHPKIIVVSIPDSYPVLAAYFGSLLIRARFIVDVRDPQEEILSNKYRRGFGGFIVKIYKYIVYRIYRKSMKLFCVTRMIAHILANKIGAGAKYIYIIPNGADLRIFKPIDKNEARGRFGLSQDVVLVAYIGPLASWAYYNLVPVLLAIRKVREKLNINIKIMVAGRCYSESFKKIIGRFKDILEYMGELETKDVVILLSACDIGIIPRIEDPIYDYAIPVKFYEYVATGLPIIVIARKQSELAEIVEKNKLGILCEPQDHICLEKAIETLAMNKGLIGEFRKNVLTFRKYIDRRIGAERLFKLIVELMQNDRFDA